MERFFGFILALILLLPTAGYATTGYTAIFSGAYSQGGFIIGDAKGAISVQFNGKAVKTGLDGSFVVGIPRLHGKTAKITLTYPQNRQESYNFNITQRKYAVQKITGIPKRKVEPNAKDMFQIKADKKQILAARSHFSELKYFLNNAVLPVKGETSGVYGSRRFFNGKERSWHKGIDIAAPTGTPVIAPIRGIVRLALPNSFFNGNLVVLDHGHNLMTIYAHLDSINVQVGKKIAANDVLGTVGATGRATGPHLHWGLYWKNMALNPVFLLNNHKATSPEADTKSTNKGGKIW